MKIQNVRLGFATNSSSAHSIVFLPGHEFRSEPVEDEQFGWDRFVLTDSESKLAYLGQLIAGNLRDLPPWMREAVAVEVCAHRPDEDGSIDHQSEMVLPRDWSGTGLDHEFLVALRDYLARSEVTIHGGNDNDETAYDGAGIVLGDLPRDTKAQLVARCDGQWWTLFNRYSGAKVRFSFEPGAEDARPLAPELVDVKLTDYCPFDCAYCYQASTKAGRHAGDISAFASWCGESRVFEVALGGGEPTLHPEFVEIMQRFRYYGVVPNFTTRNSAWLRDEELRPAILDVAGAFAVSVSNQKEAAQTVRLLRRHGVASSRCVLHVVMGTVDRWEFSAILQEAHRAGLSVTLLGYKTAGRGSEVQPQPYGWWLSVARKLAEKKELPRLGIDTPLAADFVPQLRAAGVPDYLYYTQEGRHSMYFDAVAGTFGASSYDGNLQPVPTTRNQWKHEMPDYTGAWAALKEDV